MERFGFPALLLSAAFLCALVAGFLFAFAVVVMPGIARLSNREFIRAFQVIDRIIQNGQPLFLLAWVGSAVAVIATAVVGVWRLDGVDRMLVVAASFVYVLGVQLPTVATNVPLNNALQKLDPDAMNDSTAAQARADFESRWNRWNALRTAAANLASFLLLLALLMM